MTNTTDIIARIEKLEKKNKQLRFMLFAVVGFFLAAGILAFQPGPQFFKEIKTEKLTVVDKKGKERILLFVDEDYAKGRFINIKGEPGLTIGAGDQGYIVSNNGAYIDLTSGKGYTYISDGYMSVNSKTNKLKLFSNGLVVDQYVNNDTLKRIQLIAEEEPYLLFFGKENNKYANLELSVDNDIPVIKLIDYKNLKEKGITFSNIYPGSLTLYDEKNVDLYLGLTTYLGSIRAEWNKPEYIRLVKNGSTVWSAP